MNSVQRGMSYRKASKTFKVPQTTIHSYVKKKYAVARGVTVLNHNRLLNNHEEISICNYIKWMSSQALPLTKKYLRQIVQEILIKKKAKFDPSKVPSTRWCQRFLKRHSLKSKRARQVDPGRLLSRENIESFFKILSEKITKFTPDVIFNIDETGFSKQTDIQAHVITPVGCKPISKQVFTNGHVTSVNCVSASGQNFPPMCIFAQRVPRPLQGEEPDGWLFRQTPSGFITSDLFLEWFQDIFLKNKPAGKPCLLILDAHSTHVSANFIAQAKANDVEVITIPSKSSHVLQPLDQIFSVLKETFAQTAASLKYVSGDLLTNTSKFPYLLRYSMDKAWSVHMVKAAFQRTGAYLNC